MNSISENFMKFIEGESDHRPGDNNAQDCLDSLIDAAYNAATLSENEWRYLKRRTLLNRN